MICLTLLTGNVFSQDKLMLQDFLKVKLFVSNRDDLKELYGEGILFGNKYIPTYETDFGYASVTYSSGDCQNPNGKIWNIPEWTVTQVFYEIEEEVEIDLKGVLKEMKPYKKRKKGDVLNHVYYESEEKGIEIIYDTNLKKIIDVIIAPTKSQIKEFSCKEIKRRITDDQSRKNPHRLSRQYLLRR